MSRLLKEPEVDTYGGRFATRLRKLRIKTGLTAQQFAELLVADGVEIRPRTYYNWEAGINSPPLDMLPLLAKHLTHGSVATLLPKN
jgi:transcriptional regulator with XRE-family HTH domain